MTINHQPSTISPISFWHPASLIATCFGVGKIPFAPGTMGSAAAFPLFLLFLVPASFINPFIVPFYALSLPVLAFFAGVWASKIYMKRTKTMDPRAIVIDEVAGQWLALLCCYPITLLMLVSNPCNYQYSDKFFANPEIIARCENLGLLYSAFLYGAPLLCFLLFRLFDIVKLWPASYFDQRVKNAWGVMLDDIMAAIQTAITFNLMYFGFLYAVGFFG